MKARKLFLTFFLLVLLLLTTSACTVIPSRALIPAAELAHLPYFMDDFSDHSNGWRLLNEESGVFQYDQQSLRAFLPGAGAEVITTPGISLRNSAVDVDTEKVGGPDDNYFGVVCRYQNADNYYGFLISSDGYYAIVKNIAGQRIFLTNGSFQPAANIYPGNAGNHLQAICQERTLKWVVNGETLAEVQDTDLIYGQVGLLAGAIDQPGVDVRFDQFIVNKLE
jgi:hypothetical protein